MKTFREVGEEVGLKDKTLERYVEYMTRRWASEEELQCQTGYAREWANRFKDGVEYESSDWEGQFILREMEKEGRKNEK